MILFTRSVQNTSLRFLVFVVKRLLNWGSVLCAPKIGLGIRMLVKSSRTPSSKSENVEEDSLQGLSIGSHTLEVIHIAYVIIYAEEMDSHFDVSWNSRLGLPTTCCSKPVCH